MLWTHLRGEEMAASDFLVGTFHRSDPLTILSLLKADRGGTINAGATDPRVLTSTWLVVVHGWREPAYVQAPGLPFLAEQS